MEDSLVDKLAVFFWAPIEVSPHAVKRARERLGWGGTGDEVEQKIRSKIRTALAHDRVTDRMPEWCRTTYPVHNSTSSLEAGRYGVWDGEPNGQLIFFVVAPDREAKMLHVITLISSRE